MLKIIKLSIPEDGISCRAELLEELAPKTCQMIWERLPIEGRTIHGMYSGREIFLFFDPPIPSYRENLVNLPLPGEILFFYQEGGIFAGAPNPYSEICIVYGRDVQLKGEGGIPTFAMLFARMTGDWGNFANICSRVRFEGPKLLKIEKEEQ